MNEGWVEVRVKKGFEHIKSDVVYKEGEVLQVRERELELLGWKLERANSYISYMDTFELVAPDSNYDSAKKSGCVNGGTVWMYNLSKSLVWHGYSADVVSVHTRLGSDYVIVQSEAMKYGPVKKYANNGGKIICLLGHFTEKHPDYPPLSEIRNMSHLILTPWDGGVTEGTDSSFFPHAYGDLSDDLTVSEDKRGIIFAGNSYSLRGEDWFEGLDIERVYGTLPEDLYRIYRSASVCVNLHGRFQKNEVYDHPWRINERPGMMVNERFWNVLGAGGLLVTDWVPQMERWFLRDELIAAESKEEYQYLIRYYSNHREEGLEKLLPARDKVRRLHTYKNRIKILLDLLCLNY